MTALRQRMIDDMRLRNFSAETQRTYIRYVAAFAKHFGKSPEHLGPEEARTFLLHLVDCGLSSSTVNLARCAIRFVEHVTLGREWSTPYIAYAKREHRLPVVLAPSEVRRLLDAVVRLRRTLELTFELGRRAETDRGGVAHGFRPHRHRRIQDHQAGQAHVDRDPYQSEEPRLRARAGCGRRAQGRRPPR